MSKGLKVIALEDDRSYVEVLTTIFSTLSNHRLSAAFSDVSSFLAALPELEADLILLDINLPDSSGIECLPEIRKTLPDCRIVVLSVHDDDDFVLRAFLAGADGYLLKEATPDQLLGAIDEAIKGGAPMSSRIARKVVTLLASIETESDSPKQSDSPVSKLLSSRENEVLVLLAEGCRYSEIAERLFVSLDTVKTHIRHIYQKLEVRNKAEAISRFLVP